MTWKIDNPNKNSSKPPVPAVKARLHRARRQLRDRLNRYFLG
jgi:hypothetical protein